MVARVTTTPSRATGGSGAAFGRDDTGPSSVLRRIVALCRSEREGALLIVGEGGSGKSTLLDRVLEDPPVTAVLVRANPGEVDRELSGFSAVFSAVDDRRLVELGSRFVLSSTGPDRIFNAARDILSLLRGMDLDPVVFLIDDIDRMDPRSQLLLGYMAGRLNGTGVRIVATATRINGDSSLAGFPRVDLEPLSMRSALRYARALAGPRHDEAALAIAVAESDRNPRAISHIIRGMSAQQLSGGLPLALPLPLDRDASRIAEGRTERLGDPEIRILTYLACAPVADAAALRGIDDIDEDVVGALVRDGFIVAEERRLRLVSRLVRADLYNCAPTRRRRELHERLSEAHRGIDERLTLWHESFGEGGEGGESGASALLEAAIGACAEGMAAVAVEFAERALCLAGEGEDVAAACDALAEEFLRQRRPAFAFRYLGFAMDGRPVSGLRVDHVLTRINVNFAYSRSFPRNNVNAWIALNRAEDPLAAAEVITRAAWYHALQWDTQEATRMLQEAEPLLGGASESLRGFHHSIEVLVGAINGWASPADIEEALPSAATVEAIPIDEVVVRASSLILGEDYAGARALCGIALNLSPAPIWAETIEYLLAQTEFRADRHYEGRMAFEGMARGTDSEVFRPQARLMTARGQYAEDRLDDALATIDAGPSELSFHENQPVAAALLALKGTILLAKGDHAQALRVLHLTHRVGAAYRNPALLRYAGDMVEAAMRTGATREAHDALQRLQEQYRAHPSRWAELVLARSRAIAATPEKRLALFGEATALFTPDDSPYERGRTFLAYAEHLQTLGKREEAEQVLATAAAAFQEAGTLAWVHVIDRSEGRTPAAERDALLSTLTPEELEVVELVRLGHSNKSIAEALFVSVRTVELRLTRTYRKLGVRSRLHLLTLIGEGQGSPDHVPGAGAAAWATALTSRRDGLCHTPDEVDVAARRSDPRQMNASTTRMGGNRSPRSR